MAGRIDESLPFHALRIAVLTVSDTRTAQTDSSGATLVEHMLHDKKMDAGTLPFLLTRGIGQTYLDRIVDLSTVAAFLDAQRR